jgi:hypothetical protein
MLNWINSLNSTTFKALWVCLLELIVVWLVA